MVTYYGAGCAEAPSLHLKRCQLVVESLPFAHELQILSRHSRRISLLLVKRHPLHEQGGIMDEERTRSVTARIDRVLHRVSNSGRLRSRLDDTELSVFPVAIGADEGHALRGRVAAAAPTASIEIGLGFAVSTLHLCAGILATDRRDWRHVAVDPNQTSRFHDCGLQLIAEAGLSPFVEHVNGESQLVLPQFVANGRTFDFAFVDGNHRFDRVFLDLIFLGRLLVPASVVFLDDYQLPAIRKACDFCLRNLNWSFVEISPVSPDRQWATMRTAANPDTRPFDYFVDF